MSVDIKVDDKGVAKTLGDIKKLEAALRSLKASQAAITTKYANEAVAQLKRLQQLTKQPLVNPDTAKDVKSAGKEIKDLTKALEKKTVAEKSGLQVSVAANAVRQKDTAAQKAQASALQQIADKKNSKTKVSEAIEKAAIKAAAKRATGETKANTATEQSLNKVRDAQNKLVATRNRLATADYGEEERLKHTTAQTKQLAELNNAVKAHATHLKNVAAVQAIVNQGLGISGAAAARGRGGGAGIGAGGAGAGGAGLGGGGFGGGGGGGGGGFGGGGAGRGRGGGGRPPIPVTVAATRAAVTGAGRFAIGAVGGGGLGLPQLLAYQLGAAVTRGVLEGTKQMDKGVVSLAFKQLDRLYGKESEDAAEHEVRRGQAIAENVPGGAFLGIGKRRELFSEALGVTRVPGQWVDDKTAPSGKRFEKGYTGVPDFTATRALTGELEEMTRMLVGLGQSQEKAEEQAISYGKALEQAGRLTDPVTGLFDIEKMKTNFEFLRKMMPTIGREMTGDFTKNMTKYLRSEKYTVGDRALGAVFLLGEEAGTTAAVGYHQAVKQLSGQGQKKERVDLLTSLGLLETHTEPGAIGKRGRRGKSKLLIDGPIDRELLQTDAPAWVDKHLMPVLAKQASAEFDRLQKRGEIKEGYAKEDYVQSYVNDPTRISTLASLLVGDRTAVDSLIAMMSRSQEIQQQLNEAFARSGKVEDLRKASEFSVNIASAQLSNQFKGVTGEMVRSAAPWLTEQMKYASQQFSGLSTKFKTKDGKVTEMPSASDFAGVAGTLLPVAFGASLLAMTQAKTPGEIAMAGAASGLLGAAWALKTAGDNLNPRNWGKTPDEIAKENPIFGVPIPGTYEETQVTEAQRRVAQTKADLAAQEAQRHNLENAPAIKRGTSESTQRNIPKLTAEVEKNIADLKRKLAEEQRNLIERQKLLLDKQTFDVDQSEKAAEARKRLEEYRKTKEKVLTPKELKAQEKRNREAPPRLPPVRPVLTPTEPIPIKPPSDPIPVKIENPDEVTPGRPIVPAPTVPTPTTPIPTTPAPTTIPSVLAGLENFPGRFADVFRTGADGIVSAGTTMGSNAASAIASGAAGAGASYGAAAVAAINAAVANINVTVNASKAGGDPGARPATPGGN